MPQLFEKADTQNTDRKRIEAVVETLAAAGSQGESVSEVAHDARNMVTALGLYCDLLEEPGVLAVPFTHYGNELRLVADASRRLVEKLVTFGACRDARSLGRPESGLQTNLSRAIEASQVSASPVAESQNGPAGRSVSHLIDRNSVQEPWTKRRQTSSRWELMPSTFIENMAAELLASHNLLAALAGPMVVLTVDVVDGARGARITGEDLTRVLVNLVKNASEAMPGGGRIQIELQELLATAGTVESLALTIEDSGPGIPDQALETIFDSGYTTRAKGSEAAGSWPVIHRGHGLAICRSIVEKAGGRITASNRASGGARFAIELPVRISSL